ncbi:uncharacterized protein LOC112904801 [Agrilus planipennis]|uniref:Uncharacterized protein LOC112904801 n=1 Tax=Agrilus planipennis TaxID=224129 RepID=A0A7F5R6H9_AGRPL|nr:uncharacterized protein LOC112904801 [Agrilus planipennis]
MRCVRQLATDSAENFPLASETLERDVYMDDVLSGGSTIQDALKLRDELIEVLNGGGFKLSKWASNDSRLIPLPLEQGDEDRNAIEQDKADTSKVLGLIWNFREDTLYFRVSVRTSHSKITKRSILSSVAKLFDPIGIVSPVIVKAKLIMKEL